MTCSIQKYTSCLALDSCYLVGSHMCSSFFDYPFDPIPFAYVSLCATKDVITGSFTAVFMLGLTSGKEGNPDIERQDNKKPGHLLYTYTCTPQIAKKSVLSKPHELQGTLSLP